jgi:hypothetical protein
MKRTIIIITAILLISNLPFFGFLWTEDFTYQNRDGSFVYNEEAGKGQSYRSCLINYGNFLCRHPDKDQGDNTLYRTFTIKPWRFWEWREMIFHSDRFKLPYLDPASSGRQQ